MPVLLWCKWSQRQSASISALVVYSRPPWICQSQNRFAFTLTGINPF